MPRAVSTRQHASTDGGAYARASESEWLVAACPIDPTTQSPHPVGQPPRGTIPGIACSLSTHGVKLTRKRARGARRVHGHPRAWARGATAALLRACAGCGPGRPDALVPVSRARDPLTRYRKVRMLAPGRAHHTSVSGGVLHVLPSLAGTAIRRHASSLSTPRRNGSTLPCQRDLFDLPSDICYLNAAYMGPSLTSTASVWAAGAAAKSAPWALSKDDFYAGRQVLRQRFADLVGCTDDDVAIQPSSSYGAATAAANVAVEAGQNIVTLGGEHTSNRFIWQQLADLRGAELRVVAPPCPSQPSSAWTEAVLDQIDASTAVAAVVPNYWLDGTVINLAAVSKRCLETGASLVIDGTQSVGAVRFDIAEIRPDFLFVAGYKWMLCPYRLSFFYADPKYHSTGTTIEQHGWGDRDATSGRALSMWGIAGAEDADGRLDMRQDCSARRFDMGEASDFSSLAAASDAISKLTEWQRWGDRNGADEVRGSTATMLSPIVGAIAEEARTRGWAVPQQPAPHMIGIRATTGGWPSDLVQRLWLEHSVHVSVRGPCLRVSPHVYNRVEDVPLLFAALDSVLRS